jgi:GT2 family glycosyltransferase
MVKDQFPLVKLIENECNTGFAKANNQALALAKGKYVLLLNPDTMVAEDTFENVCRFMDENPDAGGLGVKMVDGYGHFLPESKRGFPSPFVSFCKIFGLNGLFPKSRIFGRYHVRFLDENRQHQVDILAGAFMLMRRETLKKTGFLDEAFFMYGEDIDMSYRITLAGYKNYYLPERIIHYKGESTQKGTLKYVKVFYESMLIFFKKYYRKSSFLFDVSIKFAIFSLAFLAGSKRIFTAVFPKREKNSGKVAFVGKMDELKSQFTNDVIEIPLNESISTIQSIIRSQKVESIVLSTGNFTFREIISFSESVYFKGGSEIVIYHPEEKLLISRSNDRKIITK